MNARTKTRLNDGLRGLAARRGRRSPASCIGRFAALSVLTLALVPSRAEPAEPEYTVIKAGRVITVTGEEFSPGIIVLEGTKVSAVGKGIEYPPSARIIEARDETVMPGLILPRSRHGLKGYSRSGVQGDQTASSEVFLSQMDFSDLLEAGFTAVALIPDGVDVPGFASVFRTAGPDDARKLAGAAYLQIAPEWSGKGKENLRGAFKKAKEEIDKVENARKEWEEKQKSKKEKGKEEKPKEGEEKKENKKEEKKDGKSSGDEGAGSGAAQADTVEVAEPPSAKVEPPKLDEPKEEKFEPPAIDAKYQPLVDLIQKKDGSRIVVQLAKASDLLHFDDAMKPFEEIPYALYLATSIATDYNYVVQPLGERKARVILRPWIHRLPQTVSRYNLAADLVAHGCDVSLIPHDGTRDEYLRFRTRVAELVRSGLPRQAAVESMTIQPARVLGLEKKLGSIEKDKDADLIFLDGDPMDSFAKIKRVMILGQFVEVKRKKL